MTAEEYVVKKILELEMENKELASMLEMERNHSQLTEERLQDVLKMFTFVDGGAESRRFKIDAWEKYDGKQYEKIKDLLIMFDLFEDPDEKTEKEAESA